MTRRMGDMNSSASDIRGLRRLWMLTLALMAALLALLVLATLLHIPMLTDPAPLLEGHRGLAAAGSMALLTLDVFLPVPSSFLMIGNGALFGITAGTLLSMAGSLGAAWLGFGIGRLGAKRLMARMLTDDERERADALLSRHGDMAIVFTRPIPIIAETVAILAGSSTMGWRKLTLTAALGSLPAAWLYALAGASARESSHPLAIGALVFAVGSMYWLVAHQMLRGTSGRGNALD